MHTFQGLGTGINILNGDMSFAISGYLLNDGERTPFKATTMSGNFYELLNQIGPISKMIFSDAEKSFFAPMMRFQNVTISGK